MALILVLYWTTTRTKGLGTWPYHCFATYILWRSTTISKLLSMALWNKKSKFQYCLACLISVYCTRLSRPYKYSSKMFTPSHVWQYLVGSVQWSITSLVWQSLVGSWFIIFIYIYVFIMCIKLLFLYFIIYLLIIYLFIFVIILYTFKIYYYIYFHIVYIFILINFIYTYLVKYNV